MHKLSIIIPIYNVQNDLKRCLDSVISQYKNNFELILVDDGSTDNSPKIINSYKEKYSFIQSYRKENGGLGDARNYGLNKATGDYIMFIDSDDYISEHLIEKVIFETQNNPDMIVYDFKVIKGEKIKIVGCGYIQNDKFSLVRKQPSACNKVIKRELWIKNDFKFPVKLWYEDIAIIPALINKCKKIVYLKNEYYFYYIRHSSITNQLKYNSKVMDIINSMDYLLLNLNINEVRNEIEALFTIHVLYLGTQRLIKYNKKNEYYKMKKYVEDKFPNWYANNKMKQLSFLKKVYLFIVKKDYYLILRLLVIVRDKICGGI